ncbi:hypothetical protein E5288_WYG012159 [Bos mutus]|uniref:Uncharacterized protein n=1 Tax=Bos mutus TaxID=72004 RepID=A0A6B0R547_9CETA|nr:hypothetical protein [Bos mutus]
MEEIQRGDEYRSQVIPDTLIPELRFANQHRSLKISMNIHFPTICIILDPISVVTHNQLNQHFLEIFDNSFQLRFSVCFLNHIAESFDI